MRLAAEPTSPLLSAWRSGSVVTWNNTARELRRWLLATEGVLFILSIYLLRVPEISLLGQGYLLLAQGIWIYDAFAGTPTPPGWSLALMIVITLGIT